MHDPQVRPAPPLRSINVRSTLFDAYRDIDSDSDDDDDDERPTTTTPFTSPYIRAETNPAHVGDSVMPKPTVMQALLNRPSRSYTGAPAKKDYHSAKYDFLRIAQLAAAEDASVRRSRPTLQGQNSNHCDCAQSPGPSPGPSRRSSMNTSEDTHPSEQHPPSRVRPAPPLRERDRSLPYGVPVAPPQPLPPASTHRPAIAPPAPALSAHPKPTLRVQAPPAASANYDDDDDDEDVFHTPTASPRTSLHHPSSHRSSSRTASAGPPPRSGGPSSPARPAGASAPPSQSPPVPEVSGLFSSFMSARVAHLLAGNAARYERR